MQEMLQIAGALGVRLDDIGRRVNDITAGSEEETLTQLGALSEEMTALQKR